MAIVIKKKRGSGRNKYKNFRALQNSINPTVAGNFQRVGLITRVKQGT